MDGIHTMWPLDDESKEEPSTVHTLNSDSTIEYRNGKNHRDRRHSHANGNPYLSPLGDEIGEELSTAHTSDGDTTRDDTFVHLDKYLGHSSPLNCAGECNMKGYRSIDDIMVSTQQDV